MSHHEPPPPLDLVLEPADASASSAGGTTAGTAPGTSTLGRMAAFGLVMGPVAFVGAWAVAGRAMLDYSPVQQAISELAAVGAPQRTTMTLGFVAYGAYLLAAVPVLSRSVIGRCWPAVAVNALATWAVAALPLDRSSGVDTAHGVAAGIGYVALALAPALAVAPLAGSGRRVAAGLSAAAAGAIAALLALTVVVDANGLAQRLGLGIGDVWLAAVGVALVTDHLVADHLVAGEPATEPT